MQPLGTRFAVVLVIVGGCGGSEAPKPAVIPPQPKQPVQPVPPTARPASSARFAPAAKAPAIVQLAPGEATCGLDAEGRVWKWYVGEMEADVPSLKGARSIGCGMLHTCVIGADANVYCWGNNAYGGLGDGTDKNRDDPVRVLGISSIAEIGVEYARTCARTTSGDVYCWGDSEFGKAGDGRLPDNVGREKTEPGKAILTGAASLGIGMAHAFAVMPDGRLSCWGQNNSGSCGFPPAMQYVPRPAFVPKLKDVAIVRAGESTTCTIDKRGAVACWGSPNVLGPNGPGQSSTPVPVPLPGVAVEVVIGSSSHACARLADGTVHCWGQNDAGQLGDGTMAERKTVAPVKGLPAPAIGLSAGLDKTCALITSGRVFCWGKGVVRPDPGSFPADSAVPVEVTLAKR